MEQNQKPKALTDLIENPKEAAAIFADPAEGGMRFYKALQQKDKQYVAFAAGVGLLAYGFYLKSHSQNTSSSQSWTGHSTGGHSGSDSKSSNMGSQHSGGGHSGSQQGGNAPVNVGNMMNNPIGNEQMGNPMGGAQMNSNQTMTAASGNDLPNNYLNGGMS